MAAHHRIAVFRNGDWFISRDNKSWGSGGKDLKIQCGAPGDIAVPGNYFGDGIRLAVFRPSNGNWYIKGLGSHDWAQSTYNLEIQCGSAGDIPVPADYFGEGRDRIAVFRPSTGHFHIKGHGTQSWAASQGNLSIQCGGQGDIPVPADYFAEGRARLAVFRPSTGHWHIKGQGTADWAASSGNLSIQCGGEGDIPVPGDYFGDKKKELAVWRPSTGEWHIKGQGTADWAASSGNLSIQCGSEGDIPVPGDYYGNGKTHLAVFRPSTGHWHIKGAGHNHWDSSSNNNSIQWGAAGDVPVRHRYGF